MSLFVSTKLQGRTNLEKSKGSGYALNHKALQVFPILSQSNYDELINGTKKGEKEKADMRTDNDVKLVWGADLSLDLNYDDKLIWGASYAIDNPLEGAKGLLAICDGSMPGLVLEQGPVSYVPP